MDHNPFNVMYFVLDKTLKAIIFKFEILDFVNEIVLLPRSFGRKTARALIVVLFVNSRLSWTFN